MNLSLTQVKGELLLVPQFTLAADTAKGLRPGFSTAAPPELGRRLFRLLRAGRAPRSMDAWKPVYSAPICRCL